MKLTKSKLYQLIREELEIHLAPENLDELTQFNEQTEPWRQFTKYIFSNLTDEEKEALEEKFKEEEGKSLVMIINQAINQGWREIGREGSAEENNKARQQVVERVLEDIKYEAEEALKNKRSKDFWNSEETADLWFLPRDIIDNIVVEDGMETVKELHKFLDLVSDFPEDSDEEIVDEIVDFYQRMLKKATENHPEKSVEEFEDRLAEIIENHKNQALSDTSDQLNEKKLTKSKLYQLIREELEEFGLEEVYSEKQRRWACAQMNKPASERTEGLSEKEAEEMCESKQPKKKKTN